MFIESVKLSQKARSQLITLKRHTGIKNWNTLCRLAFCKSIADKTKLLNITHPSDSNVEMSWRVFAGDMSEMFVAMLKQRCKNEGLRIDNDTLAKQFRLHLHRGIAYLSGEKNLRSIADLLLLAVRNYTVIEK